MKKHLLFILLGGIISGLMGVNIQSFGQGNITNVSAPEDRLLQYAKSEFEIELIADWESPYSSSDVALDMELVSPGGESLTLPCFYVEGNKAEKSLWKAHFMAKETGTYHYVFKLYENGELQDSSQKRKFDVDSSELKGILGSNDKWTFQYDNGDLFRGVGENICWEARANDDNKYLKDLHESPRFNYHYLLTTLAQNGGNFFRTWMIYWNLPIDWKIVRNTNRYENSDSRFNESAIERMDEMVELCDSLGVHFMVALEAHGGYLRDGWKINNYNTTQGGPAENPQQFFAMEEAREMYKDKLRFMVARWGYSPAIGAFEFFNEIDNVIYNDEGDRRLSDEVIRDWHDEMSRYLKKIDPFGHLVTTSVSHRDVKGLNDLPGIDFNQKHIYRNTRAIPSTLEEYSKKHDKPYVIGEFGYEWDWNVNFYEIADEKINDYKRGLWYGLFSPTPILPMSWWWEFFDEMDVRDYFGNVRKISDLILEKREDGNIEKAEVNVTNDDIEHFAIKAGNSYFIYLFNPFEEEVETTVFLDAGIKNVKNARRYKCETGTFESLDEYQLKKGKILINKKIRGQTDWVFVFDI